MLFVRIFLGKVYLVKRFRWFDYVQRIRIPFELINFSAFGMEIFRNFRCL